MRKTVIVYDSVSGSTKAVAELIRETLRAGGELAVDLCEVGAAPAMSQYDDVIIGSPMRFGGLMKSVKRFIRSHADELSRKRVYLYQTCLYVIAGDEVLPAVDVYVDASLQMGSKATRRMNYFDRTHRLSLYVELALAVAPRVKPEGIAFFNGRLELSKLPLPTRFFMRVVTLVTSKERVGDFVNPAAVKDWVAQR